MQAARLLLGRTVGSGWLVVDQVKRDAHATGGNFSTCYYVDKAGNRAFLKAMDLSMALRQRDQLAALRQFAEMIEFEGEVLQICRDRGFSRVVRLIEQGEIEMRSEGADPIAVAGSRVYFFIFELADGDVRHSLGKPDETMASLKLRMLHQAAVGLQQLHGANIAHQDVKPSNVVHFQTEEHKLADLGRASVLGKQGPSDHFTFPGDQAYMPPEYAYGYIPPEAVDRRFGADLYLLGSLTAFVFVLEGSSGLLKRFLPTHLHPKIWRPNEPSAYSGTFTDVLPHLVSAHGEAARYVISLLPDFLQTELGQAFYEMSHPDPSVRGHPSARRQTGRPLGLDRYISLFDRLAKEASVKERAKSRRQQ